MTENPVIERRLLLAKEFYLNAIELSNGTSDLNQILAVHNFHIAVEIVLKAILIKFDIRTEKTLNVTFEQLVDDIDKAKLFRDQGLRLPLRQEIRNLNQHRNLAQHHATPRHHKNLSF